jgi:predicted metal-dependent hydrolase
MRPEDQIDICSVRSDSDDGHNPITPRAFKTQKPAIAERHWVRGDPFATALFNAFSAVFPHGETFMVRSIKPWQTRMPAALARDVSNFVKQEAAHAREHGNMNRSLIDAGYDIEPLERTILGFVAFFRNSSELSCLGVTMGIEHFTAIIAAEILRNDHHLEGASAELRELWLWRRLAICNAQLEPIAQISGPIRHHDRHHHQLPDQPDARPDGIVAPRRIWQNCRLYRLD